MSQEDLQYNGMEAEDDDTELVKNEAAMAALQWEDRGFQNQTMNALNMMRQNKQFCDVTLRVTGFIVRIFSGQNDIGVCISLQVGKQDIMAHRVVLASASPYFAELFTREVSGPSRKEVEGGGIVYELELQASKEALEILVNYAYTSM